jgi:hypothetical protein
MKYSFSGGAEMEAKLKEIGAKLAKAGKVDVGFFETATYPDGTLIATVAAMNEFGTKKAPPRPFFRGMISKESPGWGTLAAKAVMASGYDTSKALDMVGTVVKEELQESIRDFSTPGNAPSTIAKKGFDKPLVDTGVMLRSVNFEVE